MLSILVVDLGVQELVLIFMTLGLTVAGPVGIVLLVLYLSKRRTNLLMKKCPFCAYGIPMEARVCGFCTREAPQ